MKTRRFRDLSETTKLDPERRARIQRDRADALAEVVAHNLAEMRKTLKVTQLEVAHLPGVKQPTVAGIEHGEDMPLSTLRNYVEALGGRLERTAVFDEDRFSSCHRLSRSHMHPRSQIHPWAGAAVVLAHRDPEGSSNARKFAAADQRPAAATSQTSSVGDWLGVARIAEARCSVLSASLVELERPRQGWS